MVPPPRRAAVAASRTPSAGGTRRPVVLLTGFDAFGSVAANPSGLAARALHGRQVAGHRIVGAELPTVFGASAAALHTLLAQHAPVLVVCTGVAQGRSALSVEQVAVNQVNAPQPDNAGAWPCGEPVVARGPASYASTLPTQAIVQAWQEAGLPAELSLSAGRYVCNHLFYSLMDTLAQAPGAVRAAGFIHVPLQETLALEHTVWGIQLALRCALDTPAEPVSG